jgi:large repetitive protein
MRKHTHQGPHAPHQPRPRARSHPLTLVFGLLLVAVLVGAAVLAVRSLYLDYQWRSTAEATATAVAQAITDFSESDDSEPTSVDAVAAAPSDGQVTIDTLPYRGQIPAGTARIRLTGGGALSVVTTSGALCAGVTLNMTEVGRRPSGTFACDDPLPPPAPVALRASPHDESVTLEWPHPAVPVDDFVVSYSANDGASWITVEDGVASVSRATVSRLANGQQYVFRVAAINLVGESPPTTATAMPFTKPGPPTDTKAVGGFTAVVTWTAPKDDGGRPITGFVVTGDPQGRCTASATATRCEVTGLPAAPGYRFIVRAVNEAGLGTPSTPATDPIAVYSVPGRAVAITANPGDGVVLLTWVNPLEDGNTPITDYRVQYRVAGDEDWIEVPHPISSETTRTVSGLVNGTTYEFQVLSVNAVGVSEPPLSLATATPATIPGQVPSLETLEGNESVALTWQPPLDDGHSPVTDYMVQFHAAGEPWTTFDHPASPATTLDVTGLENGTRYAFRVGAVNAMGTGPWSPYVIDRPVGPPGPVVEPESVGSLTEITLTWKAPENNGGRRLLGYRVSYKLSSATKWIDVPDIPANVTTATVDALTPGEAYDFRIVAFSRAGVGPATPDGADRPTLAGVIADETPPAPTALTAVPGDGQVALTWNASPAGKKSPITAYTVTGSPIGTCTVRKLTCVIAGLTNGVRYSFTVNAANANIIGPESKAVSATPRVFNEATGGVVTTYTRGGRTFRVHTFTTDGTLTITRATGPFRVLVVAGGGGSVVAADGTVSVGGGGGIINARRTTLPAGVLNAVVGRGGDPGVPGGVSSLDYVGSTPAGAAGSTAQTEFSPTTTSAISGTQLIYGGTGTPTSGPGIDGTGIGGGGPIASRGGNGVVIVSYEVAR